MLKALALCGFHSVWLLHSVMYSVSSALLDGLKIFEQDSSYNSTIETIDSLNGTIISEGTSQNINVSGLIKSATSTVELSLPI